MASTLVADRAEARSVVERFSTQELAPLLEPFQSSGMLEEGRINLIGLDAIAERLGATWDARQEQVYQHVEHTLARHVERGGFFQRVSPTDYLVVQPALGKFSGQVSCLRYLRALLTHFLGAAAPEAIDVLEVTSLSGGRIFAAEIDRAHAFKAAKTEAPVGSPDADAAPPTPSNPFISSDGRSLKVSCHLEPVFELKGFSQIGFRIVRRVLRMPDGIELNAQELQNLTTADVERIDLATIARGVSRLGAEQGNARQPSLFLPVSWSTLASPHGRGPLIARFKAATEGVDKGLVCEISDFEGVPGSVLTAVTRLIKPFCLIVVGKLREAPNRTPDDLCGVRLQGVAFEGGGHPLEPAEFSAWAEKTVTHAKRVARSVIIHGLAGPEYLGLAGMAGASHASLGARRAPPTPPPA